MYRFLFFAANCLIFVAAENDFMFCRQRSSIVGPIMNEVVLQNLREICAPGFQTSIEAVLKPMCYNYAAANSISFETFSRQCICQHGYPVRVKDNRVRFKRHFRGYQPYAAPLYGQQQHPVRAVQAAKNPLLDENTFQCSRHTDHCDRFPQPTDNKCPPGFIWFAPNQDCYKFHSPQTWHEAERICQTQNSHLSSVRMEQELKFIADMRRQIFPNNVNRIQTHPLIIEEYDTWIGLNLTDRSKLAFRTSNSTWTEGFNLHTYVDWNTFAKLDNAGGNENCGFVKYRHDCTVDNFIQISIQDARCDIQLPFACRLKRDPPTAAPTVPPPTTTTAATEKTTAEALVKTTTSEIPSLTPTATIETTNKVRETCMV